MKKLAGLWLCVLLTACATPPPVQQERPQDLFNDQAFGQPTERIDTVDIFALDAEMQHYLDNEINRKVYADGKIMALFNQLFHNDRVKFSYDAAKTRGAADVFRERRGNCLSFTIMTAAFAKQMGLPIQFHNVANGEIWDRNGNLDFLIGHVNVTVGYPGIAHAIGPEPARVIDFAGDQNLRNEWSEDIGEDVIVAMYLNNRSVEELAKGDLANAYWWARAAIVHTPAFLGSYNTLGVIYTRNHMTAQAEAVFRRVLEHEHDNVVAMSNEVQALNALGRHDEAQALKQRLTALQPYPPYYFFNRGIEAMRTGDFKTARSEFTKEVNRASYNHQFHYWLALADYYLGDVGETRKQLTIAMENSPNPEQHDLYAAKLAGIATAH